MKKLILSVVFLFLFLPKANASLLFFDDYEDGPDPAWGNERGDWFANDGRYDAASPSNSPLTYTSLTTFDNLTDFIIDVDVFGYKDGGIWVRSSDQNNGLLLVLGGGGGSYDGFYWHIVENGIVGAASPAIPISGIQGTNAHIKLEALGDSFSVYVNDSGTPESTFVSDKFASGKVALYDYLSETSFDNFLLSDFRTAVPEPTTMVLFSVGLIGIVRLRGKRT